MRFLRESLLLEDRLLKTREGGTHTRRHPTVLLYDIWLYKQVGDRGNDARRQRVEACEGGTWGLGLIEVMVSVGRWTGDGQANCGRGFEVLSKGIEKALT